MTEQTATAKPGDVTYAARVAQNRETGNLEVVVTRDVYAGVCGPATDFELPGEPGLDSAELRLILSERGYQVVGDWEIRTSYQGMTMTVEVMPY